MTKTPICKIGEAASYYAKKEIEAMLEGDQEEAQRLNREYHSLASKIMKGCEMKEVSEFVKESKEKLLKNMEYLGEELERLIGE